jgi:hypothetical protein
MSKKQTALDLYVEQSQILQDKFDVGLITFLELCRQKVILLDQAKQMEKEQIMKSYYDGEADGRHNEYKGREEYYNETYGGQEE